MRTAWPDVEDQILSNNARVTTAAVELVCNLVQSPAEALSLFAGDDADVGSQQRARDRLNVLVALADAKEAATRSAAGGALASLTSYEPILRSLLVRPRGIDIVLGLCRDDSDDLRHRGAFVVRDLLGAEGSTGIQAREALLKAGAVEALTECARKSRRAEVVEMAVETLKALAEKPGK